jgi:hypothetical protein
VTTPYVPPPWLIGEGNGFALTVSDVAGRDGPWQCPGKVAHNARGKTGSVRPNDTTRWRPTWDKAEQLFFALRDGLAALEDGATRADATAINKNLTAGQRRFVAHALAELTELRHLVSDSVGEPMAYTDQSTSFFRAGWGEVKLTGPEYVSANGTIREAVRMAYKDNRNPEAAHILDFTATAAMVLASGQPDLARIRVSEFGLDHGTYRVLFDGSAGQAQTVYASRNHPQLGHLVAQTLALTDLNPGSACGGCPFLQVCPGPQRIRGALGIPTTAVATRAITSTDLAIYDDCPARYHLQRRSHLPVRVPEDFAGGDDMTARQRGIAAHTFLRWAHSRSPHRACTADDLPDPQTETDRTAALLDSTGINAADYPLARPYLLGHLDHCLLGFDGLTDFQVEPRHTVYDPDADVVLIAEPDLTLSSGPATKIWRETKTRRYPPPENEYAALAQYPAFAFHVCLLYAGVDGNARDHGAAELEVPAGKSSTSHSRTGPWSRTPSGSWHPSRCAGPKTSPSDPTPAKPVPVAPCTDGANRRPYPQPSRGWSTTANSLASQTRSSA